MSEQSGRGQSGEAQFPEQHEISDQHSANTADCHHTDIPWWRRRALQIWLMTGLTIHVSGVMLEFFLYRYEERAKMPKSVEIAYGYCTVAYACNLLLSIMRWAFARSSRSSSLLLISCFISSVSSTSYLRLWTRSAYIAHDVQSVLFLPTRWWLYMSTMPAIWWILSHISAYSVRRRIYVLWLNSVMLVAGGLATIPCISWGHKVYWMVISCVPFPELCYHIWRMLSDAIESSEPLSGRFSLSGLYFVRVFGQFSYQLFPAIYFAAYDGCLPLYVSEPLWSICDWCLKMCMTSSLMEAEFFTVAQKLQYYMHLVEQSRTYETMKQLMLTVERKDRFLSVMSHELRTPLNGIIGMADAITTQHGTNLSQAVASTIGVIKLSGKRLMQLINDLLDAAQLRKGHLVLKHEEVNLIPVIDDVMQQVMPFVQEGVVVYKRVYELPQITGDSGRIEQVLFNLTSNAAKFTHSGYIRVGAGYLPNEDMVFLYVRDTGCGIEASVMPKVFGVFEQADMTTTRAHGGAGLGLHFVKELVRAHRGKISLKSMVGAGTLVTVRLPLSQPEKMAQETRTTNMLDLDDIQNLEEPVGQGVSYDEIVDTQACQAKSVRQLLVQPVESGITLQGQMSNYKLASAITVSDLVDQRPQSEPQSTRASGMPVKKPVCLVDPLARIKTASGTHNPTSRKHLFHRQIYGRQLLLSVDDDPINQMVVSNLLQPMGCRVQQAMNGHEALAVLEQATTLPDLVLLDCMMPGMSGYSVCQYMRSRYGYSLPVMMVSANSETKDVLKGLEHGANDYIRKPFQREDLHMRVQAHIHTMQLCDTEVEARLPWSLLHLSITKQMEAELRNGAEDVSISVPCAAVFYIMMQPLQAEHLSGAEQADSGSTRDVICSVMPMMQVHCSVSKVLFVQKWSTCLVFMTNPEVVSEEECLEQMHVFAENTMAMLIEACKVARAPYPAAAVTAGPCMLTCLSAIPNTSRLMLFGEPMEAAKALVTRCPAGHILLRPQRLCNPDRQGSNPDGSGKSQASSYASYIPQNNPNVGLHFELHEANMRMMPKNFCSSLVYQFWPILELQSDLHSEVHSHEGAKNLSDEQTAQNYGRNLSDNGNIGSTMGRVLEYMCYARSDFHTLALQWKRLRPNDASAAQDTAIFSRLAHAVKQVFELSELHEQKHLSGNADSTGSHTLNSILSVSGGSHEDGGRLTSEGLTQLQFQSEKQAATAAAMESVPADDDLVGLANRVGIGHTANWLTGCGLTVQALAKMTEAELASLTGDLLPKRSRILLLLQARQAVKSILHAGNIDNTSACADSSTAVECWRTSRSPRG